jgi:hypothetical protein
MKVVHVPTLQRTEMTPSTVLFPSWARRPNWTAHPSAHDAAALLSHVAAAALKVFETPMAGWLPQ